MEKGWWPTAFEEKDWLDGGGRGGINFSRPLHELDEEGQGKVAQLLNEEEVRSTPASSTSEQKVRSTFIPESVEPIVSTLESGSQRLAG